MHFFVSDVHLGSKLGNPAKRESEFIKFLKELPKETKTLFLLGDIFDYWFEYKNSIQEEYRPVLNTLKEVVDRGIKVYFAKGNHDWWTFGYLEKEIGLTVIDQPYLVELDGKLFCVGHGDALGVKKLGVRLMTAVFHNKLAISLYKLLPKSWTKPIANYFSYGRKGWKEDYKYNYKGDQEPLCQYLYDYFKDSERKPDFYVFGHYHTEWEHQMSCGGVLYILPDWIQGSGFRYFGGIMTSGGSLQKMLL